MNTDTAPSRSALIPVLILLCSFGVLLFVLLVSTPPPSIRITPQNIHRLHETLRLENIQTGFPRNGFALSSDNSTLLVTSTSTTEIWRLKEGRKQTMDLTHSGGFISLMYFDDGQPLASFTNWGGSIRFLNLNTGQTIQNFDGINANTLYADWNISPDHRWFVSSKQEADLSVVNLKTGQVRFTVHAPSGFIFRQTNPTFSPDGRLLATSLIHQDPFGFDVFIWDAVTGQLVKHLDSFAKNFSSSVRSFAFSPDGKQLAVGGGIYADGLNTSVIQLWNLETDKKLATWHGDGLLAEKLYFTPDGQNLLATGTGDMWLWNIRGALKTETPYLHLRGDGTGTDYENAVLSHDGRLLAASTPQNDILLYEVKTATLLVTLHGHSSFINQVAFSDDDQFLISSSNDNTVRFWSVSNSNPYPSLANLQPNLSVPAPIMTPTVPG